MNFNLECSEHLVFRAIFLIQSMIQNIMSDSHLALVWPQELPVEHMVVTINDKNTWKRITRMQILYPLMQWKPHSCILKHERQF